MVPGRTERCVALVDYAGTVIFAGSPNDAVRIMQRDGRKLKLYHATLTYECELGEFIDDAVPTTLKVAQLELDLLKQHLNELETK